MPVRQLRDGLVRWCSMPLAMADPIEDVWTEETTAGPVTVLGQVGEGHAIVGGHGMDLVRKYLDHTPEEGRAFHLAGAVVELDMGELRDGRSPGT